MGSCTYRGIFIPVHTMEIHTRHDINCSLSFYTLPILVQVGLHLARVARGRLNGLVFRPPIPALVSRSSTRSRRAPPRHGLCALAPLCPRVYAAADWITVCGVCFVAFGIHSLGQTPCSRLSSLREPHSADLSLSQSDALSN